MTMKPPFREKPAPTPGEAPTSPFMSNHYFPPLSAIPVIAATAALMATPYYYLAPLPALALVGALLLSRNPDLGYYAIVFLIPYGAFRKIGGINVPWLFAGLLVLIIIRRIVVEKRLPDYFRANLLAPMVILVIIGLLSARLSPFPEVAYKNTALHAAAIVFVVLGMAFLSRDGFHRTLPKVLITSISIGSVLALLGFFFHISLFAKSPKSGIYSRSVGASIDANNLSLMTIFIIPLLVHQLFHARTRGMRIFSLGLLLLNLLTIVTTYSRSGLLVLIWCGFLLFIHYGRQFLKPRNFGVLLALFFMGTAAILPLIPASWWERQASIGKMNDTAMNRRVSYLLVAWDTFLEAPFLGSGPGTFYNRYENSEIALLHARKGKDLGRRAHNTYLEIVVGTGVLGLTFYVWTLWLGWKNFRGAERTFWDKNQREQANLTASYRIAYLSLLTFLLFFSEEHHKYLLLSLPLSHVARRVAEEWPATGAAGDPELPHAAKTP